MLYGRYRFSCQFETEAVLPEYKGSTFRGVFGHALKRVVCALRRQDCFDCLLRQQCVYSFIFETSFAHHGPEERRRIAAPPHPYVIEPPEETKTHFGQGDTSDFTLILFGKANDFLPYFIYAIEEMGRVGIGKGINGKRAQFSLRRVTAGTQRVYSSEDKTICAADAPEELTVAAAGLSDDASATRLELLFVTPIRLKFQNKLEASLPFHVLTRTMLRRIASLSTYYGNGEPPLDYRGLVSQADSVSIAKSSLSWFDWKRYSNKQDQSMFMGGMVGAVTYEGELGKFIPLVRFCEKVHLGKQTSFGLGKLLITEVRA